MVQGQQGVLEAAAAATAASSTELLQPGYDLIIDIGHRKHKHTIRHWKFQLNGISSKREPLSLNYYLSFANEDIKWKYLIIMEKI